MSTHTPGPWYATKPGNPYQGIVIDERTGANIAVTYDKEYADLIASAPDLLQMVRNLVDLASMRGRLDDYKALLADARALIAKAEGRD